MRNLANLCWTMGALIAVGCSPEYPNCNNDEDCHEGEFCVDGHCAQCRDDSDCSAGEQCVDGSCDPIPGYCGSNADCPDGQECQNNRCTPVQSAYQEPEEPQACQLQTVYFSFDSSELEPSARDQLQRNAECIQQRNISSTRLTGYTDPRGTEEYNLALGDRRARAARQYMISLGVNSSVFRTSSVGEEMSRGQSESGWTQDRRVELEE